MKIKSKLLITFLIILILFFSIATTSFGYFQFDDVTDTNRYYVIPDLPEAYATKYSNLPLQLTIVYHAVIDGLDYIHTKCFYSSSTYFVGEYTNSLYFSGSTPIFVIDFYCPFGSSVYDSWNVGSYYSSSLAFDYKTATRTLLYTSKNITKLVSKSGVLSTTNEVFFPTPPQQWGVKLVQPMEVGSLREMVNKIITILLPVGLIILSIFLVVYLIASKKWFRI